MNSFYSEEELKKLKLKSIGKNVLISRHACFYGNENISIGNNVRIDDFCILSGNIVLGDYIHISAYTALYGGKAGIFVSDYSTISSRVSIYSSNDDYSGEHMTSPVIPDIYRGVTDAPVYIEKYAIIGSTSIVLPGITVKEGSSCGSFSFINEDTEEWSINIGIPCKKIKDRSKNIIKLEENFRNGNVLPGKLF